MIVEFWNSHSESILGFGYKALLCIAILFASTLVVKAVRRFIRKIWGNSIKNYTRNGRRRMDIVIGIDYSDSIDTGLIETAGLTIPFPQRSVISHKLVEWYNHLRDILAGLIKSLTGQADIKKGAA